MSIISHIVNHLNSNGAIFNDVEWPLTWYFKVTPFFDTEYLTNGYRYNGELETAPKLSNCTNFNDLEWPLTHIQGHDNIQRPITQLIVSRVWSIQWFRFQWPWVTVNLDSKVTALS